MKQAIAKCYARFAQIKQNSPHSDLLTIGLGLFNFLVPRQFGLLSACYDADKQQLKPSWRWLIFSGLMGHVFLFVYPFAVVQIIQARTSRDDDDSGMSQKIEILQHAILYLFSVAVYLRQICFANHQINIINRGLVFYRRCDTLCEENIKFKGITLPHILILRAMVSYFGYAVLNVLTIFYFYGDLPQVWLIHKVAFCMPNIVITTTQIRFHSAVMMLTVSGRRVNRAFRNCIESVNRTENRTRAAQQRACQLATERFESIVTYHAEWHTLVGIMERSLSILMLISVINNVINLTSTVSYACWGRSIFLGTSEWQICFVFSRSSSFCTCIWRIATKFRPIMLQSQSFGPVCIWWIWRSHSYRAINWNEKWVMRIHRDLSREVIFKFRSQFHRSSLIIHNTFLVKITKNLQRAVISESIFGWIPTHVHLLSRLFPGGGIFIVADASKNGDNGSRAVHLGQYTLLFGS